MTELTSRPTPRWRSEDAVELAEAPVFELGDKVRVLRDVRNDGTYPGSEIGAVIIREGDQGYVTQIGTFLQQFWIYSVDFYERRIVVGMRAKELALIDGTLNRPKDD